jgi:DNA-binding XRE family transcriptional regulator
VSKSLIFGVRGRDTSKYPILRHVTVSVNRRITSLDLAGHGADTDGMETLGKRLQRLRESRGMTQDKLAHKAKVSVFNIRNWEQDHRTPGLAAVYHLARALGVTMEDLAVCVVKNP